MELSLPETFEAYSDARKAGFLKVKAAKEGGRRVAGTFCTFTPLEILDAAGMLAVSLCGMSAETIPAAEVDLPRNLCPLIKSSYGFFVSDKCPYTYFSDLIVGETTCDGKKKMYELMARGKELFLLHLPQGVDLPYARDMWRAEVRRLKEYLEERFGAEITDDALRAAARQRNALREARSHLMEVLRADPAPVSGTELYKVLDGLGFDFDLPHAVAHVEELAARLRETKLSAPAGGPRLLVTGCPIGGVYQKVLGAAERAGAQVVCFENCAGIKPARCCVDAEAEDILAAIADAYLTIGCAVMTPNRRRFDMIPALIEEFHADAVLDIALSSCHTYLIEGRSLRELCRSLGVPYMALETDYSQLDAGQIDTRIAAFVESL